MNTTFFALGVHRICAWDFSEARITEAVPWKRRWRGRLRRVQRLGRCRRARVDVECAAHADQVNPPGHTVDTVDTVDGSTVALPMDDKHADYAEAQPPLAPPTRRITPRRILTLLAHIPPPTYAVCLGLLFSLVPPLKALLTPTEGTEMPDGPDGLPPLHFVLDTAAFLGGITVPLALILLGASFARLKVSLVRGRGRLLTPGAGALARPAPRGNRRHDRGEEYVPPRAG